MLSLDLSVIVSGIMIGSTFGLIAGFSREEKIRYIAISVFGGVLVAALGGLYAYGASQLEVLLSFLFWSCLGFLMVFTVGAYLHNFERSRFYFSCSTYETRDSCKKHTESKSNP